MRIMIAGSGMSGSYLYRRLKMLGYNNIDIFGVKHETSCKISPCAWGVSEEFDQFIRIANLDPDKYILKQFDHIMFDEIKVKANLKTINKPKLIRDLLQEAEVQYTKPNIENYDRIIDATGAARAYLPPIPNDLISPCCQYRMTGNEPEQLRIKIGKVGYTWVFPLTDIVFHVGAGSLVSDPAEIIKKSGLLNINENKVLCSCGGKVRITGPRGSLPFFNGKIIGVSESVGVVASLAGDGIVPGLQSCEILLRNWNDLDNYTKEILREFAWMEKEREVVERLQSGKPIGLGSALVLQRNTRRMDMKMGLWDAFKILRRAGK